MPTEEEIRQRRKEKFNYDDRDQRRRGRIEGDHLADDPMQHLDEGYHYPREFQMLTIKRQAKPFQKWAFRIMSVVSVYSGLAGAIVEPGVSRTTSAFGGLVGVMLVVLLYLLVLTKPIKVSDDSEP